MLEDRLAPAVFTVNLLSDGGTQTGPFSGDLRFCIGQSNNAPGNNTIVFDPALTQNGPATINLSYGPLFIYPHNGTTTVQGPGAGLLTVDGGNRGFSLFWLNGGASAVLDSLTLAHGYGSGDGSWGGAIYDYYGTLTVSNCTLTGNTANVGGGIANYSGTVTVTNCTLTNNTGVYVGGALFNVGLVSAGNIQGTMTVTNSTLSGNSATDDYGGAIENEADGVVGVNNCTFLNNSASIYGGAINNFSNPPCTVTVCNSTFANNTANSEGGAIFNQGILVVSSSTLSGNSAASGAGNSIFSNYTLSLVNTIVANGVNSGPDVLSYGGYYYYQNNVIQTEAGNVPGNGVNGNIIGQNPLLSPLGYYGGPTETFVPLPGSPALGTGVSYAQILGGGGNGSYYYYVTLSVDLFGVGSVVQFAGQQYQVTGVNGNNYNITPAPGNFGTGQATLLSDQRGLARVVGGSTDIGAVQTQPLTVNTSVDGNTSPFGQLDLRQAVNLANVRSGSDTITFDSTVFAAPQTITLTGGVLPLSDTTGTTTIQGPGANLLTIDGNHTSQVFQVNYGVTAALNGLTIADGFAILSGGIQNDGTLTITGCTLAGNSASGVWSSGGAVMNGGDGTLTLINSTVSGNSAPDGGGLKNYGRMTVLGSTISGNTATQGGGGAILNEYGTLTVSSSTISANSSGNNGALFNAGGSLTVTNSTIARNTANGGGIVSYEGGSVTLNNDIVALNSFGFDLSNGGANTSSTLTGTNNVILTISGLTGLMGTIAADPILGLLANNGGPTMTMALLPGSPALDAGSNAAASGLTTDQRGYPRVTNNVVDIGAFESHGFTMSASGGDGQSAPINTAFANPLTVTVTNAYGEPVAGGLVTFAPPGSGATATLAGSPATIGSNGQASVTATANGIMGPYAVTANAAGANSVAFSLANTEAPSLVVTTLTDDTNPYDGLTSLREAIAYANTLSGPTTITFQSGLTGTITLTGGPLTLTNTHGTMTIQGPGANLLTVDGNYASQVFVVNPNVTAVFDSLTIAHGSTTTLSGGGISGPDGGTITVSNSVITGCSAQFGGGIYAEYQLTVSNTTFTDNSASLWGGGLFASFTMNVSNCTFTGNSAAYLGGGLYNGDLQLFSFLSNSTFTNNTASYSGGGVYNNGTLELSNSTFVNNTASAAGGGIENGGNSSDGVLYLSDSTVAANTGALGGGIDNTGSLSVTNTTIAGNAATSNGGIYGGGIENSGTMTLANTIVARSLNGAVDLYNGRTINSAKNNLVQSISGGGVQNGVNGNIVGQDPLLAPLGSYGGATPTMALLPGSPALDAGSNSAASGLTTDQRGLPRVSDGTVDIGAFESRGFNITVTGGGQSVPVNTAFANLNITVVSVDQALVTGGTVGFAVPSAGASATLTAASATLPAGGQVSLGATANGTAGTYSVTIDAGGGWGTSVSLTNFNPTPASGVNALAARQSSDTFSVPATYYNPTSQTPAGISSVDLYASTDGGAFSLVQTLPADPTAISGTVNFTFTGADRNTYAFHSIAHSVTGAVESKSPTLIEASTYVPDLNPPVTHAIAASPSYAWGPFFPAAIFSGVSASAYNGSGQFNITWAGADPDQPAGGTIASLSIYEQIDSNAPTLVGTVTPGSPGAVTYNGTTYYVYSGSMTANALGDGQPHNYSFYSIGTDDQKQQQATPAAADVTFSNITYTAPLAASLSVEKGIAERSYIRYLDVNFNQTLPSSPALQALQSGLAGGSPSAYVELLWYGENLTSASTAQASVNLFGTGTTAKLSLSGSTLSIDLGANGVTSLLSGGTGSPKTTFGDGWYALGIDPCGDPSQNTVLWLPFFRLLGDVNGNGVVTGPSTTAGTDANIVSTARGQSGTLLNADVNGDGTVNTTDLQEVSAAANAHAAVGSTAPSNFPSFQLLAGPAGSGAVPALTTGQLDALLPQAIAAWRAAGLGAPGLQAMQQVRVEIANLGTSILGVEYPGLIEINRTAAGHAWSLTGRPTAGQVDLRTVLEHELGHVVGLADNAVPGDLMNITLAPGVQRSPSAADARQAAFALPAQAAPAHAGNAGAAQALPAGPGSAAAAYSLDDLFGADALLAGWNDPLGRRRGS